MDKDRRRALPLRVRTHFRSPMSACIRCIPALTATLCSTAALAQTPSANRDEPLEEIVITGIRASLERSIEIKRNADTIVDSIASEDLGKFPDANVAESLQRITGVSISRNNQGEGTGVTVRGFGPQFNATLLNGRVLPAAGGGGPAGGGATFGFDQVAAELMSGADVYKSSNASLQEGGIGSLINLRTARPFDTQGSRAIVSAKGTYEDLSSDAAPSFFALYSTRFADDRWGALISGSYQKRKSRTDSAGVQSYLTHQNLTNTNAGNPFDPSDDVVVPLGINDVFFPRQMTHQVDTAEPTRLGFTGVLQFQPADDLLFTLDTLWSRYEQNSETYQLSVVSQFEFDMLERSSQHAGMATKPKRPRDTNQLAKFIADIATGQAELPKTDDGKDPAAVALGRKGGLKGGKARAESMTAKQRSEIAKKAAKARWAAKSSKPNT